MSTTPSLPHNARVATVKQIPLISGFWQRLQLQPFFEVDLWHDLSLPYSCGHRHIILPDYKPDEIGQYSADSERGAVKRPHMLGAGFIPWLRGLNPKLRLRTPVFSGPKFIGLLLVFHFIARFDNQLYYRRLILFKTIIRPSYTSKESIHEVTVFLVG